MKNTFRFLVAFAITLLGGMPTLANTISGGERVEFQTALTRWLDGEDKAALASFAALARDDNRAAQMFLAQVEVRTWLHHHVTGDLSREDRHALLRNSGGPFGTSWLASAAQDTPLAVQLLDARKPYKDTANGMALLSAGELSTALSLPGRAYNTGDALGALELALHERALPYTSGFVASVVPHLPLLARSNRFAPDDPRLPELQARLETLPDERRADHLMWGHGADLPPLWELMDQPDMVSEIGMVLLQAQELAPLVAIVERHCTNEAAQALGALQVATFGEPLTFMTFSPLETLLTSAEYQSSPRFEADVLRQIRFKRIGKRTLRGLNDCAFRMAYPLKT